MLNRNVVLQVMQGVIYRKGVIKKKNVNLKKDNKVGEVKK